MTDVSDSGSDVDYVLPSTDFEMTVRRVEDYVSAIGDDNPVFRRTGRDASGVLVPPALASAFMQDPVRKLFSDNDALEVLGIDGTRVVFGEVDYEFEAPIAYDSWVHVEGRFVHRKPRKDKEVLTFVTTAKVDDGTTAVRATITFVRI